MSKPESFDEMLMRLKATANDSARKAERLREAIATLEKHPEHWEIIRFLTDPSYRYE